MFCFPCNFESRHSLSSPFCSGASSSKWEHQNWKPNSSKATLTPWPFEDQSFLYTFDRSTWIFQQVTFLHLSSWLTAVCQKPGYCAIYFKLVFLHNSKEPLNQGCGVYPCPLRDVDITFAMNNIKQSRGGIRLFFYTTAGYSWGVTWISANTAVVSVSYWEARSRRVLSLKFLPDSCDVFSATLSQFLRCHESASLLVKCDY